ncbi:GntR family transcriptional regulator [Nonomuraea sp. LPB2021202275-12-8]|uniref:GntR family transcriptional regulator n=1 Tax=Nonomuraea sp. LPB2021202275-12-8 TaxID=3120159 RepID=UPI003FA59938
MGVPFWKTIRDEVRRRIATGEYGPTTLIVESRLADEFATTRITVRKAMASLREEGLIATEVGVGSRVIASASEES